jgi:hypothetical protein
MGVTRLSLANLLLNLVPTGLTADTGYSLSWLTDDQPWRVFRNSAANTSFQIVIDRGAPARVPVEIFAAFGCGGATSGPSILGNLGIEGGPDGIIWGPLTSLAPTPRGDFFGLINASIGSDRYQRWTFTLKASEKLVVGLLFGGQLLEIPLAFDGSDEEADRGIILNDDTDGGGTYAAQTRTKREIIQYSFALRQTVEHLQLLAIEEATAGALIPIVLQPNTDEPDFFHGRILNAQHWQRDPGIGFMGHSWQFKQSGSSW